MSGIDWSKAPKDATHYLPESEFNFECWVKSCYSWRLKDQNEWHPDTSVDYDIEHCVAIPRPKEWTGTGLPPVGTILETCAYHIQKGEWTEVEILAHAKHDEDDALLVCEIDHDGDRADMHGIIYRSHYFRPIRTQEQIEAEEREREVQYMLNRFSGLTLGHAALMYDAGYRRQPTKEDA